MSTDEDVTKELIETLQDGKAGFAQAADKIADSDQAAMVGTLRELSAQRDRFATELRNLADSYGDDIKESGSVAAKMHRGWMSLKDALTGSSPHAVLAAAEKGEDHAVTEYEKALKEDISANLRTVVERQFTDIKAARTTISTAAKATS